MPTRRPAAIVFAAGLVVIVAGTAGLLLTRHSTPALRPVAAGVAALPAPTGPIVAPPQSAQPAPVASPVSLTIPLIGVKTQLITLGLAADGAMQVPVLDLRRGLVHGKPAAGRRRLGHHRGSHRLADAVPGCSTGCPSCAAGTTSTSSEPTGPRRSSASPRSRRT